MGVRETLAAWLGGRNGGGGASSLALKASRSNSHPPAPPFGGYGGWLGDPWPINPPGSTFDYVAAAGDPDRNGTVAISKRWLRVNAAAGPKLCVGQIEDSTGEYDADPDNELTAILKNPNPYMTWAELIGATVSDLAYPGFSYWLKVAPRGGRKFGTDEFYYLPRRKVQPRWALPGDKRPVRFYEYYTDAAEPYRYDPNDIIHFRNGQDPVNPWQGYATVNDELRSIAALNTGENSTASLLNNGHRATIVTPKENNANPWDENTSRDLAKLLRGESSRGKYGGIAGSPFPIETHQVGFSPDEAMLDSVLDRPSAMIVAAFGLNELVLGLPGSDSTRTYSNLGEAYKQAFEAGLLPLLAIIADAIQNACLRPLVTSTGSTAPPDFGDGSLECWFDTSDVAGLREAADSVSARSIAEWEKDGLTWDEFRDAIGRTPVGGERGKLFFSELGMQRAMEVAEQQAEIQADAQGDQADEQGSDGGDAGDGGPSAASPRVVGGDTETESEAA